MIYVTFSFPYFNSPSNVKTRRRTPWAAGCWGPKFNVKFFILLKNLFKNILLFILNNILNKYYNII